MKIFGSFRIFNLFLLLLCNANDQQLLHRCSKSVQRNIENIYEIPESLSLPFGKAFVAKYFGAALVFKHFLGQHVYVDVGFVLSGSVRPCRLFNSSSQLEQKNGFQLLHLCNITLYGRLVGPEILMARIDYQIDTQTSICFWRVSFPKVEVPGDYSVEIFTQWINDAEDPTMEMRGVSIDERINSGRIVHLGALGIFPVFTIDQSWRKFNFDGLAVRPCQGYVYHYPVGKKIFIVRNWTVHEVPDQQTLHNLGYSDKEVRGLLVSFFKTLPEGTPLPPLDRRATDADYIQGTYPRKAVVSGDFHRVLSGLREVRMLRSGNEFRVNSKIFGLPDGLHVAPSRSTRQQGLLPLCSSGEVPGRWVREPLCDAFDQNWGKGKGALATQGSECTHASTVYYYAEINNRSTSMVWRPYTCRLAHHSVCGDGDVNCVNTTGMGVSDHFPNRHLYSSASSCLTRKGIPFIAGFGDSLGDEQWRNVASLLGIDSAFMHGEGSTGLVCGGGGTLHVAQKNFHYMGNTQGLISCVEQSTEKAVISYDVARRKNESSAAVSTIVLVTNFMAAHLLSGKEDMAGIAVLLKEQAVAHVRLAARLQSRFNVTYRRIFFSGTAAHGFRNAGFTRSRMEQLNSHARAILGAAGWEILDAYNVTLPRPDGTTDGHHYRGGVSLAVTDVLMTMICNAT